MNSKAMKVAGVLFISILSTTIGYTIGIKKKDNNMRFDYLNSSANNENQNNAVSESTSIAVVNLDEGASVGNDKIYYSENVLQFPTTDFTYTSLQEAEQGMENGKYGGYIIIPSDFSQNAESLNSIPQITDIEYTINDALSGKTQYDILYNILSFSDTVNNNLSYMYIDSILDELHTAQDNAKTVMNNDEEDWDTIQAIKEEDLVRVVKIPELKNTELNINQPDITPLSESNNLCASNLNEKYLEYVSDIEGDLEKLNKSGNTLTVNLDKMSKSVEQFNVLVDEKGNKIENIAKDKISDTVDGSYMSAKKGYIEYIDTIEDNNNNFSKEYQRVMDNLDKSVGTDSNYTTDVVTDYVINSLQKVKIKQSDHSVIVTYEDKSDNTAPEDTTIPVIQINASFSDEYTAKVNLMADIIREMKTYLISDTLIATPTDVENISIYEDIIRICDEDKNVKSYLGILKLDSTKDLIDKMSEEDKYISEDIQLNAEGNLSEFNNYVENSVREADIGKYVKNMFTDATDYEGKTSEKISDVKKSINEFVPINKDIIISEVNSSYITPITTNVEKYKRETTSRYTKELSEINKYNGIINAFSPNYDSSFVDENISKIRENNADILEELIKNNGLYIEYAGNVYQDTYDNIQLLQERITEADKQSAEALNDGLAEIKIMKEDNTSENQAILKNFSEILPYTRLGSLEYRKAYEFIVEPDNFKLNQVNIPVDNSITKKETKFKEKIQEDNLFWIFVISLIAAIFVVGLFGYIVIRNKNKTWQ